MNGTPISLVVKHSTGKGRELRCTVAAVQYGPVAHFTGGKKTFIVHVASGRVLLEVTDMLAAALATESLRRLVTAWAHGYDGRRAIFSPSLVHAIALVRG